MKKQLQASVFSLLCLLGIFLLAIALAFAGNQRLGPSEAPNIAAGLAACGFAVAAGFCFVAAAIAYLGDRIAYDRNKEGMAPSPADRLNAPST